MVEQPDNNSEKRDWRVSAILLAIWIAALAIVTYREIDIPLPMIAMATVFFILLIPAMNDLVRSIERYVTGEPSGTGGGKENT